MAEFKSIFRDGAQPSKQKLGGSMGPRTRGGKRRPKTEDVKAAPVSNASRGNGAKSKAADVKASTRRAKGAGLSPIQRAKPSTTVQDIKQTIAPMDKSGLSKNKAVQIGRLFGRTASGEWYLGRKKGKG